MRYEWFIAQRYLKPQGGTTFIFHLTLFSIGGVALGVASLVTVLSVMNGFGNDLRGKIMQGRSHLVIHYRNGVSDYQHLIPEFETIPNVAAAAPVIMKEGMLYPTEFPEFGTSVVMVFGIDPDDESNVTGLKDKMIAGSLDSLKQEQTPDQETIGILDMPSPKTQGIVIGKELAMQLIGSSDYDVKDKDRFFSQVLGYRLTVVTIPNDRISVNMGKPNMQTFRIDGVFETGHYDFDQSWVFVSIPAAQYLTDRSERVTHIRFRLHDYSEDATLRTLSLVQEKNSKLVGYGFPIAWMHMDPTFFEALKIEKATMDYILKIIILVATFNIIATLFMIVMAKTRDIGLLRAVGASRRSILKVFLLVGVYIGLIGTIVGLFLGVGICSYIDIFPPELPGHGQVYNLRYLPCDMEFWDFFSVSIYTFCISFLASLYPAIRAARQTPVDAIRYS